MSFKLTDTEKQSLKKLHRTLKDKKGADKIKGLILLSDGYSYEQIEEILLLDERTIRRYKETYKKSGVGELLKSNYTGGVSELSIDELNKLSEQVENNLYSTSMEVCNYVEKTFGKTYTANGMTQLLKRLGFSHKNTKLVSKKADRLKQEAFVKEYEILRKELKPTEKIYFMDGVHPTYNVMPSKAWIKKGKEKEISCNTGRQRLNINGVYSPIDQEVMIREDETISYESTINLFKQIETKHPELTKIYIIRDNARYYVSKEVTEYLKTSRIVCVPLPVYSLNLNLIERLWKYSKEKLFYNRYYESFKEFKEATLTFFNEEILTLKDNLKKRLSENFHLVNSYESGQT